jgi:hypothetical protein
MYISASVSLLAIDPASFSIDSVAAAFVAASGQEDSSTVSVAVADFPVSTTLSLSGGTALLSSDLSASLAVAVAAEMPTVLGGNISVAVGGAPAARRRLLDVSVPVNVTGLGSSATAATAVSSALQAPDSLSRMATAAGATGARASIPVVTAQLRVTVSLNPAASTSSHAMALNGLSSPTGLQSALSGAGVQATVAITGVPAIVVATAAPPKLLPPPQQQLVVPNSSPQPPASPVADGKVAAPQAGSSSGSMMPAVAGAVGAGALCIVAVGWYCRRHARRRAAIPSMKLMMEDEQSTDTYGKGVTRARNLMALLWVTRRKGLLRVAATSEGNEPGTAAAAVAAFDGVPSPPVPPRRHHERHHDAADGVGRRRHGLPLLASSTVAPSLRVPPATEPPPPPPPPHVVAIMALPPPPLPPLLPPPPPPPASVPLQTQMRAFVDMAGASCTACGSGLIIVRSNRREAAGGDGTAAIIRCSLFLVRAADGQRMCRRRVDERTVIAWYDASVSAGRLPQAAR